MLDIGLNNPSRVDTLHISAFKSHNGSWCFDIDWNTPLVFDMLLLGVWISDQTLLFVFEVLFEISVFGYQMLDIIGKVQ